MIPRTEYTLQSQSASTWQQQLSQAITEPRELIDLLQLDPSLLPAAIQASQLFRLRVPHAFVQRMQPKQVNDPLLRQVLPINQELIAVDGYRKDPLEEQSSNQTGLIQKYKGRVLLLVNGHCAVNCRYCFRRHFPYEENRLNRTQWSRVIDEIMADKSISEVIYSGGDPLASSDRQLGWLTEKFNQIPHIQRLRIHTRLPVVIPDRINEELLGWLKQTRLQTIMVLHLNHPNEIDIAFTQAIDRLQAAKITLLNQSVLLKGINDNSEVLIQLSEKLFQLGILPYYLHLFDPVAQAAHFDVNIDEAKQIYQDMQTKLPGYLLPRLVREIPGESSKTPININ